MRNFAYPYFAASISDFWRRWHISLSTWLKDYVYVPLGGSRGSVPRWVVAVLTTFLLSGLWHGAAWHFVAWGALHGLALLMWPRRKPLSETNSPASIARRRALAGVVATFSIVCAGWVLFRAESLADAGLIFSRVMTDIWQPGSWAVLVDHLRSDKQLARSLALMMGLVLLESCLRRWEHPLQVRRWPLPARWLAYTVLLWATLDLMPSVPVREFIYFQF
jgi:hypothetical protein